MKEARMSILKMVEEGKINADDAVKLLDAVGKTGSKKSFDTFDTQVSFEEKIKSFSKNMEEMGRELGKKLDEMGKDVEPKIRKVAQTIINKTTECVDEISTTFKKDGNCCCESDDCCETTKADSKDENCDCCCDNEPKQN